MSVSSDLLRENSRGLLREEEPCDDEIESPINDDDQEFPSTSMRVVLVDSDPNFLRVTKNLMTEFSYQVTVFINGDEAMAFLMKHKHEIDLVIWDFNVADINGLEALNTIGKEMDLPVAIMSHDNKKETVMKSTKYGACHFLVKPVSKEVTAVLWQHVYRKRMSKSGLDPVESDRREEDCGLGQNNKDLSQSNEEGSENVEDSGEQNTCHQKGDKCKKQRIIWTPELHHKFEKAIAQIGSLEKAVPKQILKIMQEDMNVEGLNRNNVASHLQRLRWQKYRQNAERKQSVPQETREDSVWRNDGPSTSLAASKVPLLNSSFSLHSRVPYFTNGQAAANSPLQYPSSSYLTMNNNHFMTNPLANLPYTDSLHQPQQPQQYLHQQYYHSSLQSPSVIIKQESAYASAATESPDLIANQNSPFMDLGEFFPPGLNNFDPNNRY